MVGVRKYYTVIKMLFDTLKPMLLSMKSDAFDADDWVFEPKLDGWRIILHKDGNRIEAFTRHGRNVTAQFPELQELTENITAASAILDCEGVCVRDGRSIFDDFQYRGRLTNSHKIEAARVTHPTTFVAFDVLYLDGFDLTTKPLLERKEHLHRTIIPSSSITPIMFVERNGVQLKKKTEQLDWEGIVAKKIDSNYKLDTRSSNWLKIKNWHQINAVILGYTFEPQFGLIVGLHFHNISNKPVATVHFGINADERAAFLSVAKQIHTVKDRHAQWIEPVLCCRVQYLERTERHNLRNVSFKGFILDKSPDECVWVS
jgi:bifunctional non-homologous end joining protein LigD